MAAQEDLKRVVLTCPAIRAIDYTLGAPVILAVDMSNIAIGFFLAQQDPNNPKIKMYGRFGSITLNDRERRFSQVKLELYGMFQALQTCHLYLLGVRNLIIKDSAHYIKGMLQNPDIAPSVTLNRWIMDILTFHFTLVHVPGIYHGPGGLS